MLTLLCHIDDSQVVLPIFNKGDELKFKKLFPYTVTRPAPVIDIAASNIETFDATGLPNTVNK
jgi:hypothetical protein